MKYSYMISEKYCENWTISDAIREIIANALDTGEEFDISHDGVYGVISNKTTCLESRHLLLGESTSRTNEATIGQFGEGFKIAALVFTRAERDFRIKSGGNEYIFSSNKSEDFGGVNTLAVEICKNGNSPGTIAFFTCSKEELDEAKLRFIDINQVDAYQGADKFLKQPGSIYVQGVRVAQNYKTLFGYNLSNKKLLNRDRTILEKNTLNEEIRLALSNCSSEEVISQYIDASLNESNSELLEFNISLWNGISSVWKKVIQQKFGDKVVISGNSTAADARVQAYGYRVIKPIGTAKSSLQYCADMKRSEEIRLATIKTVISEEQLSNEERKILHRAVYFTDIIIGHNYQLLQVSEQFEDDVLGQREDKNIFLNRKLLASFPKTFSTLCHEMAHIDSCASDGSLYFESMLTEYIERIAEHKI